MTSRDGGHGQYRDEILDHPIGRNDLGRSGEEDHTGNAEDGEEHAELELLEHLGDLNEEVGELGLLGGGTPRHVDFEHVGE